MTKEKQQKSNLEVVGEREGFKKLKTFKKSKITFHLLLLRRIMILFSGLHTFILDQYKKRRNIP